MRQPSMVTSWLAAAKAVRNAKSDAPAEALGRRAECEPRKPRGDAELGDQHPAAPAPEPGADQRRIIFVDDRRPGELEGKRERRIAHEPDRRAADPRLAQPDRLGREDQKERQPRGEAEREHEREARISQNFAKGGRFADRCHGSRMAEKPLTGDLGLPAIRKRPFPPSTPSGQRKAAPDRRGRVDRHRSSARSLRHFCQLAGETCRRRGRRSS